MAAHVRDLRPQVDLVLRGAAIRNMAGWIGGYDAGRTSHRTGGVHDVGSRMATDAAAVSDAMPTHSRGSPQAASVPARTGRTSRPTQGHRNRASGQPAGRGTLPRLASGQCGPGYQRFRQSSADGTRMGELVDITARLNRLTDTVNSVREPKRQKQREEKAYVRNHHPDMADFLAALRPSSTNPATSSASA